MAAELSLRQAFDRLVTILDEKNLSWIVTQIEDQIRQGKPATRRVKELRLSSYRTDLSPRFPSDEVLRPGREVQFRATEEYTDTERLELMLSAIRQAIVSTAAVAKVVTQHFSGLIFVSEQDEHEFAVSELESRERLTAVDRLQHALDELKTQLG
jgi:hypothetical protein